MKGRTQRYYDANPAANQKRLKQQSRYQKTKKGKQLKHNAYLGSLKIGKKGDGKDVHHLDGNALNKNGRTAVVSASKNRSYARTRNARKRNRMA